MSYQQYQAFEKAIIKDQYNGTGKGKTTNYLGYINDVKRAGLITKHRPLGPNDFQKTPNTWRACKTCAATKIITKHHMITGQMSLETCPSCNGRGEVFG